MSCDSTYKILVGSYTRFITTLSFTPSSSSSTTILDVSSALDIGHNPSWISQHPSRPNLIFAALENPHGEVALVKVDAEGKGHVEGYADSGGDGAVHVCIDEQQLIAANVSIISSLWDRVLTRNEASTLVLRFSKFHLPWTLLVFPLHHIHLSNFGSRSPVPIKNVKINRTRTKYIITKQATNYSSQTSELIKSTDLFARQKTKHVGW